MGTNKFTKSTINHYDLLIDEGIYLDSELLREYMDKWDGQAFIDEIQLTGKESVLEIGVGTGRLAVKICCKCSSFTGIDISSKTVKRAKENLAEYKNIELIYADFMEYDFKSQFDIIYSSLTFMHIENKLNAISKIASLLKTGGTFILSIDNNPSNVIDMGTRKIEIYPDNADDIYEFVKAANLTMIKQFNTEFASVFVARKE